MPGPENAYEIGKYPPVNQVPFLLSRASAIQSYANLEFSLSFIFSNLLGANIELGGLVFFRITNTHSRRRILDDLEEKKFGNSYDEFWNSAMSFVSTLDQRRNEIIHWHVVNNINLDLGHEHASSLSLRPPAGWATKSIASIADVELNDFIARCEFMSRLLNMFCAIVISPDEHFPKHLLPIWRNIFSQPIAYPPPDAHPLSPNYKEPQNPQQVG